MREWLIRVIRWLATFLLQQLPKEDLPQLSSLLGRPIEFPPKSGRHRVLITQVVDGDTVRFCWLTDGGLGRLKGIDAPEMRGESKEAGEKAKSHLTWILPESGLLDAEVYGRDKYGRTLVDLILHGVSINRQMILDGHAAPYDGGPRTNQWQTGGI